MTKDLDVRLVGASAGAELEVTRDLVTLSGTFERATGDQTVGLEIRSPIAEPSQIWLPHLTPSAGNVIGDAVFRSPAIVLADDALALVLVVDLDDVRDAAGWRVWLDYDHEAGLVTLAAGAYRVEGHVFYAREPLRDVPEGQPFRLRMHVLTSREPEDLANPYAMAARFFWTKWGAGLLERTAAPPVSLHMERIAKWAFSTAGWSESVWQETDVAPRAAAPVFIVDVTRHPSVPIAERTWRERRSIWNQAWFSTQRCANGLLRYARQIGSADLEDRARQMTEIALAAPQRSGLFPAVLVAHDDGHWRWTNSDRRPPSASAEACHLVDAAFTCRMLLEWHELTGDARARAYVEGFAERLLALQRPNGSFPGWVEPDGRVPPELAEGPESAACLSLLFELGHHDAAVAGLAFLADVTRGGRWEDFETYYSCAPWGAPELIGKRTSRNGIYKQNTLSIHWCAEAFWRAFRVTNDPRHAALARRCLDELSLYQAVWNPPYLPAPAHGGFGVMNADSEWNDARQSLFAPLYLEMGHTLSDAELVERGVSAIRASFSMLYCPENAALARAYEARYPFFGPETYGFMMENQGHGGADPIGTFTIFAWGNGSALATAATVRDRFPAVARACGLT